MKAYGFRRKDKLECGWGCCKFKKERPSCKQVTTRIRRKRARRKKIEQEV